ncbi:MAG: TonB family protein [Polyangiales bacterium]
MRTPPALPRYALASLGLLSLASAACSRRAPVEGALPLKRVVIYRNGVGYFERQGSVDDPEVRFLVQQRAVGDFLASLTVMERGGSSVRAAAFPMPEERPGQPPRPDARRAVTLALDGRRHELVVGYTVETPIWRPSYRLVLGDDNKVHLQAWGIVQNLSGEDWTDVRLSLVAGSPVSFRSELATPVTPRRPVVTDQGAVIDNVPLGQTTLAQDEGRVAETPAAQADLSRDAAREAVANRGIFAALAAPGAPAAAAQAEAVGDAFGYGGLGATGTGWGGGGAGEGTIGLGNIGVMGRGASPVMERGARAQIQDALPSVSGALSSEVVRRVVRRNLGQVRACHEMGLRQNPSSSGRVTVRFVVGADGSVAASDVAASTMPDPQVASCVASVVRRWQFPAPDGGGAVTVSYPFTLSPAADSLNEHAAAPATVVARNANALAGLAVQGGATRYDLRETVTVPDRSATMVLLSSRELPGRQMYLFSPDPGVPDSSSHPFHVARFENRTGGHLERGSIAILEAGAYLGQGMLEPLPDAATATVPFALERAVVVDHNVTTAVEGARLLAMRRGALTIERYNVERHTWGARNGLGRNVRVMIRQPLGGGASLHEPPAGTEPGDGDALVPIDAPTHGRAEVIVTTRAPFSINVDLTDDNVTAALEQHLREGHPAAATAAVLTTALEQRRRLDALNLERSNAAERRDDLQRGAEETRANLEAIRGNGAAADLRARLLARLARSATDIEAATRRIVELDTQLGEARVRLADAVQEVDLDVSRQPR